MNVVFDVFVEKTNFITFFTEWTNLPIFESKRTLRVSDNLQNKLDSSGFVARLSQPQCYLLKTPKSFYSGPLDQKTRNSKIVSSDSLDDEELRVNSNSIGSQGDVGKCMYGRFNNWSVSDGHVLPGASKRSLSFARFIQCRKLFPISADWGCS